MATCHFTEPAFPAWFCYQVLSSVSRGCPCPQGRLATCYSAFRPEPQGFGGLAWLNRTPIAVVSGRINRNRSSNTRRVILTGRGRAKHALSNPTTPRRGHREKTAIETCWVRPLSCITQFTCSSRPPGHIHHASRRGNLLRGWNTYKPGSKSPQKQQER